MYFPFGRSPEYKVSRRVAFDSSIIRVLPAVAQHSIPLTMAEAGDRALLAEPGQEALKFRAQALKERGVVAGELPDPVLSVGLNNYPIQSGGFSTEGMTHGAVGVRQTFPAGKTRSINTRRFNLLASEMDANAEARGRDVLTAARSAWLDLYYWELAHGLVLESRPLFDDLTTVEKVSKMYCARSLSSVDLTIGLSKWNGSALVQKRLSENGSARTQQGPWPGSCLAGVRYLRLSLCRLCCGNTRWYKRPTHRSKLVAQVLISPPNAPNPNGHWTLVTVTERATCPQVSRVRIL